ncbi:MAG: lamin tail domain-containing protein [Eubacteriales bacterium]
MQNKTQNKLKIPSLVFKSLIFISLLFSGCSSENTVNLSENITLRINEYQIHNEKTLRDSLWNTPDWIEIYNYGEETIWLGDKYISDDSDNPMKYLLPDIYIDAHCYVLIYASSQMSEDETEIHANFKLSENDEQIYLTTSSKIIDYCDIEDLPVDVSAGMNEKGDWVYFSTPSPGVANIGKGSKSIDIEPVYIEILPIVISEYSSSCRYAVADHTGEPTDWIEIYNPNDTAVNLNNYYISDDASKRCKCRLPDYELAAGEYALICASGEKYFDGENISVSFSLGEDDALIMISAYTGVFIDKCDLETLPQDISAGVSQSGEWAYFAQPTPAEANTTASSASCEIQPIRIAQSGLLINEIMPNNKYGILDMYGDTSDWVEIYNPSTEAVSLSGFALTDDENILDKWLFPEDAFIGAKGYLLVFLSNKDTAEGELHACFAIGGEDEKIQLVEPNGAIASSVEIEQLPGNVSKGRLQDGTYGYFTLPTPAGENTGNYETSIKNDQDILLSDVYISEVSAGAFDYYKTGYNYFEEYIEIHNKGAETINLAGYTLSDASQIWIFPDVSLASGEYLIVQLKGTKTSSSGIIRADMSISSAGETIIFRNAQGTIIDAFDTGYLTGDVSSGRLEGQGSTRYFFVEKTPQKENSTKVMISYCSVPQFSHRGGMVDKESILLEMTCKEGESIRYTTDGSKPDLGSAEYTAPIFLNKDTVIRAASFANGKLPSKVVTRTFIFGRKHSLPIVCLSSDNANLFGNTRGIYADGNECIENEYPHYSANFWRGWECETAFEYYNENNDLALDFDAGLQIAGQFSREYGQKSLVVRIRDEYGMGEVYFPFFENSEANEYKHILLRNSGQDIVYTKIKDIFIHQSVKEYSDIDIMDGRPVVVYINGRYWGLYNLREKQNEDYIASHYGIDSNNVTIIKSINTLLAGNTNEWSQLMTFIGTNNFEDDTAYSQLTEMVDVDTFIDYLIIQTFYGNYDIGNIKYWKENGSGKWRPLLFDVDMALTQETSHINYIEVYFRENDYTKVFRALFQNQNFKDAFVERYAYFLNNVFTEEKLFAKIDELAHMIDSEIYYQDERFNTPSSYEVWRANIEEIKEIIILRRKLSVEHLQQVFGISDEEIEEMFTWY